MNKLTKLPPAWQTESVAAIRTMFSATHNLFLDATRKAVFLGLALLFAKERGKGDKSIPHGEFGPWLKRNLPEIQWSTCNVYMNLARNVAEKGEFQITDYQEFAHAGKLPAKAEALIAGKTQSQLFLEFKQTNADGNPQRGRPPGEGGKSSEPKGDIAEITAFHRKYSIRHMGVIDNEYNKIGIRFLHCEDDHIAAFVSSAERAVKVGNYWLNTAPAKRDHKEAERIWNQH